MIENCIEDEIKRDIMKREEQNIVFKKLLKLLNVTPGTVDINRKKKSKN